MTFELASLGYGRVQTRTMVEFVNCTQQVDSIVYRAKELLDLAFPQKQILPKPVGEISKYLDSRRIL